MKILLAYDATSEGQKGLDLAVKEARAFNAEVIVFTSTMMDQKGHAFASNAIKDIEHKHSEAKKLFEDEGIACATTIQAKGRQPAEDIVSYAEENNIDLVIIGVRIRSKVGKLLIGSTAQYVILKAPCPVLSFKAST